MKKLTLILSLVVSMFLLVGALSVFANGTGVSGRTLVYYGGHTWIRWDGVQVTITNYSLISTTVSGPHGAYSFAVPNGTYTLTARVQVGCKCYHGIQSGVIVSGMVSKHILLENFRPCCIWGYFPVIFKNYERGPIRP